MKSAVEMLINANVKVSLATRQGEQTVTPSILQLKLPSKANQTWQGLTPSALSLAVAHHCHNLSHSVYVICASNALATQTSEEIRFFLPKPAKDKVLLMPDREILPYDMFSADIEISSLRLQVLHRLFSGEPVILVVSVPTLMYRLPPVNYIADSFNIVEGESLELTKFCEHLEFAGYQRVHKVMNHGEYACRGALLDLYPTSCSYAVRIDLLGDSVESLYKINTETQLREEEINQLQVMPAHEIPLNSQSIQQFRLEWHERFTVSGRGSSLYQSILDATMVSGIESYLPLFFKDTANLFDYINKFPLLVCGAGISTAIQDFWQQICQRFEQQQTPERPPLPPEELFLSPEKLYQCIAQCPQINVISDSEAVNTPVNVGGTKTSRASANLNNAQSLNCSNELLSQLTGNVSADESFLTSLTQTLRDSTEVSSSIRLLLFCASEYRIIQLLEADPSQADIWQVFQDWQEFLACDHQYGLITGQLGQSFKLNDVEWLLLKENHLKGGFDDSPATKRSYRQERPGHLLDPEELHLGDLVVHIEHGIGRYQGVETLTLEEGEMEVIAIEYAKDARLYIPVLSLGMVNRYIGNDGADIVLDEIGGNRWQKRRLKAVQEVRDVAAEMLLNQAQRETAMGMSHQCDVSLYQQFCDGFSFTETPDQLNAINAVLKDMESDIAMDRLICGDTGFGKTEVAMRATFIASSSGSQVVILAPTTLLVKQHLQRFRERFEGWSLTVAALSSHETGVTRKRILQQLSEGKIDIIIGTHALLGKGVKLKQCGLLIVDEEHRFGVTHKERIKAMRQGVDTLSLTATPIPRTLHMSMIGLRDISIIATAPPNRQAVKTFVGCFEEGIINEAIARELVRGGQIFYVCHRISSIPRAMANLQEIFPQLVIAVAHSQLPKKQLDSVMTDFYYGKVQLLVCTTIIEAGIDVPNANTIIIERADYFGLAQLHQLRGRVGRSHHQGYAYLLGAEKHVQPRAAKLRLQAIANSASLGSGFNLAVQDLEIRGAGQLLGDQQSGKINDIGYSLYRRILQRAIAFIKKAEETTGVVENLTNEQLLGSTDYEVKLEIPALLPAKYLPEVELRLEIYRRLANTAKENEVDDLYNEIRDRYGNPPQEVENLFCQSRLRIRCIGLGISELYMGKSYGYLEFTPDTPCLPATLVALVQDAPHEFRLAGENKLVCPSHPQPESRVTMAKDLLATFEKSTLVA